MKKKRGILYWLKVIVAILLIFILMYRCSHNYGLTAHAEGSSGHPDSAFVDLTPAQTLALFGTEIQGLLVTEFQQPAHSITFDYAFPLSSVGYMDSGGGFSYSDLDNAITISSNSIRDEVCDYMSSADGLVYIASASQWGGTSVQGYNRYGSNPVQLHCPFSISLTGIGGIQQAISYPTYPQSPQTGGVGTSGLAYASDNVITWLFGQDQLALESLPGSSYANVVRAARYNLPTYPYYEYVTDSESGFTTFNPIDDSQLQKMSGFYLNTEEQPDPFDCSGFTIDVYGITSSQANSNDLWLVVQCPRLWSYNPPVITTTRPAETIPAATFPVATMPTDITDVPSIIINDNSITQVNQLNVIIGQLNLIYAKLVANGELGFKVDLGWNPDLQDGESLPYYDTVIQSQMHDIINGHTTATVPNFDTSFVKDGYDFLTDNAWIAKMGALSLALSVAAWIIFRGRGG